MESDDNLKLSIEELKRLNRNVEAQNKFLLDGGRKQPADIPAHLKEDMRNTKKPNNDSSTVSSFSKFFTKNIGWSQVGMATGAALVAYLGKSYFFNNTKNNNIQGGNLPSQPYDNSSGLDGLKEKGVAFFEMGEMLSKVLGAENLIRMDQSMRDISIRSGVTLENSELLRKNIVDASSYTARLNMGVSEVEAIINSTTDVIGRVSEITNENLRMMGEISKGAKMSASDTANMVGSFNLIGRSMRTTRDYIQEAVNQAELNGLNASKIINDINKNLDNFHRYTFKDGIKGISEMAKYSERIGITMKDTFSVADKASTLEGAIEMATRLQTMGGKFGQMDAMQLAYMAQYDPENLQKMFSENIKDIAGVYRDNDGTIQIAQSSKRMLQEISKISGMDYGGMIESVLKQERLGDIERILGRRGFTEEQMGQIAGLVSTRDGSYSLNGKDIASMTTREITDFLSNRASSVSETDLAQRAMESQGFTESIERFTKQIETSFAGYNTELTQLLNHVTRMEKFTSDEMVKMAKNINPDIDVSAAERYSGGVTGFGAKMVGGLEKNQLIGSLFMKQIGNKISNSEMFSNYMERTEDIVESAVKSGSLTIDPMKLFQAATPLFGGSDTEDEQVKDNSNEGVFESMLSLFTEIKNMFSNGIPVKFENDNVHLNVEINNEIDGEKLADKQYKKIDAKLHADRIGTIR